MKHTTIGGAVMALCAVAGVVFAYVAIHELVYAGGHPYAYGPAYVIAAGAGAGVALTIAVSLVGYLLTRDA